MATRRFVCADCGNTFEAAYGTGTPRAQMTCPHCGGKNIRRAEEDRGYAHVRGSDNAGRGPAGGERGRGPTGGGRSRNQMGGGRGRSPGHGHR